MAKTCENCLHFRDYAPTSVPGNECCALWGYDMGSDDEHPCISWAPKQPAGGEQR